MKLRKTLATLLALLTLISAFTSPALAGGKVKYEGGSKKFVFEPGSSKSPTDLFENFKDVMPGDTITDTIEIRNKLNTTTKIKVYIRSLGAQERTDDFLAQMRLSVKVFEGTELFDADADERAQLQDWVYLGKLMPGGSVKLDLTLEVPIEMGNEFQNQTGYIDWEFRVIEEPYTENTTEEVPKTGDDNNLYLYGGLILVSVAAIMILIFVRKKKKDEK